MPQNIVRDACKQCFRIDSDKDFILHDAARTEDVSEFAEGRGTGPDKDDLHLDALGKMKSTWNKGVVNIILAAIRDDQDNLPITLPSDAYLSQLIEQKLENLRAIWRRQLARRGPDGSMEDIDQIAKRMESEALKAAKASSRSHSM